MSVKQTTDSLTDEQRGKLVTLLEAVEGATDATEAVWLAEEDREEIAEIRRTIEGEEN